MSNTTQKKQLASQNLILNAALGFLTLLLLFLIFALITRIIYPRIVTERANSETHLISNIIQIEVLNGCGVPGVANRFTSVLRSNGFDVVESGNFETFDVSETIVIDRAGNYENARRVAAALGIKESNIIQEVSPAFYLDATLVIGSDYEKLNIN